MRYQGSETDDLYLEARRIIALLQTDFVLPSGRLCLKRVQGQRSSQHVFPDLGDVIPFLLYFGANDFVQQQLVAVEDVLQDGLLVSEFPAGPLHGLVKSYEYSDFLLGLLDYYLAVKTPVAKEAVLLHAQRAQQIFGYGKTIHSWYKPGWHWRVPIQDSRDGMMIELFVGLYQEFGSTNHLAVAEQTARQLLATPFYRRYKLFPSYTLSWLPLWLTTFISSQSFARAKIGKANSNTLWGLLSLWQVTRAEEWLKAIDQTIIEIERWAMTPDGGVATHAMPGQVASRACLTPSFVMLDFLCDLYHTVGRESDRQRAIQIADFWLAQQAPSGLFPLYPKTVATFVDSETDMGIALYKLTEITDDQRYRQAADRCFDGIELYHRPHDYPLSVDCFTGTVLDSTQKTKFLALFLKTLILRIAYHSGSTIYGNPELFHLLKDR